MPFHISAEGPHGFLIMGRDLEVLSCSNLNITKSWHLDYVRNSAISYRANPHESLSIVHADFRTKCLSTFQARDLDHTDLLCRKREYMPSGSVITEGIIAGLGVTGFMPCTTQAKLVLKLADLVRKHCSSSCMCYSF